MTQGGLTGRFGGLVPGFLLRRLLTVENAIWSSPESASTWNSCDWLPPMAPESARTARKRRPARSKMRE